MIAIESHSRRAENEVRCFYRELCKILFSIGYRDPCHVPGRGLIPHISLSAEPLSNLLG